VLRSRGPNATTLSIGVQFLHAETQAGETAPEAIELSLSRCRGGAILPLKHSTGSGIARISADVQRSASTR
jgi:hypothetical protein